MKKITLLDGATGTRLWALAEKAGVEKVSTWRYNLEHPEFVTAAELEYIQAGSDIILTNTFSANGPEISRVADCGAAEVVTAAVKAAKTAVAGTGVKVALDIGPLSELLEPYGDLEAGKASAIFAEQMEAGAAAGAELIFIETFMDLELMKLAVLEAKRHSLPVFSSMSFSGVGKTMFGNSVADVVAALAPLGVDALGLNCSLGPDLAAPIIRQFASLTELPLIFKPNAGMPIVNSDGSTSWPCSPEQFAAQAQAVFGQIAYVGGCCGTDAGYIRALARRLGRI